MTRSLYHRLHHVIYSLFSRYLAGGIESGFKKVEKDKYEPRLLHVKGRRNIRVQETRLAWTSMNSGDVFIFDEGLAIWVWNGKEAGRMEKIKGLDVARRIRDEERGGRAKLEVVGQLIMCKRQGLLDMISNNECPYACRGGNHGDQIWRLHQEHECCCG